MSDVKMSFYRDCTNGQVFSILNFRFTHLEFHRNASVHYSNDKLNNGTHQVILNVHCVFQINLTSIILRCPDFFFFPFAFFFFLSFFFFFFFFWQCWFILLNTYLKNYPSSCQIGSYRIKKKKKSGTNTENK